MHFLSIFVATLSLGLVHFVLGLPVPFPERLPVSDSSLTYLGGGRPSLPVGRALALDVSLLKQDGTFSMQLPHLKREELERRVVQKSKKLTSHANSKKKRIRRPKPILRPTLRPENTHLPPHTKIVLGEKAKKQLDALNLHGKARKNAIGYHKGIVKAEMKKHGALEAEITHIAHSGGSDPTEPDHITAKFWAKDVAIPGAKGTPSHHLYIADHNLRMPKSFTSVHVP